MHANMWQLSAEQLCHRYILFQYLWYGMDNHRTLSPIESFCQATKNTLFNSDDL